MTTFAGLVEGALLAAQEPQMGLSPHPRSARPQRGRNRPPALVPRPSLNPSNPQQPQPSRDPTPLHPPDPVGPTRKHSPAGAHSVQSPKKRFFFKKRKKRTSKTLQGNNKSWLQPPHGLASCGASSRGSCIPSAHWAGATQLPPWRHAKLEAPHPPPCPFTRGQLIPLQP